MIDEATYEDALRKPWPLPDARCTDGGSMCTDCEAQGRCGADFEDSQRAALYAAEDAQRESSQIDRLVNWGFTALIIGFGMWALFW